MVSFPITLVVSVFLRYVLSTPILSIPESSIPTYDVIIVGGGPAGLSAASALGRVRRSALLIDSGEYRKVHMFKPLTLQLSIVFSTGNAQTQHMHDVIGNDGTAPSAFRTLARELISVYTSISMTNGTVTAIRAENNGSYFTTEDQDGEQYLSKKVILATGMKDILPNTPGLATAWGRGIYCKSSLTG